MLSLTTHLETIFKKRTLMSNYEISFFFFVTHEYSVYFRGDWGLSLSHPSEKII